MVNNKQTDESSEHYQKSLYRFKLYYPSLINLLDIHFGGDVIHTDSDINRIYLQHCIKIEKILNDSQLSNSFNGWKPFDNLLSLDLNEVDIDWEYGGRRNCLDIQSRIDELYIRNGSKSFELDSDDKIYLDTFHKFLEHYKTIKHEKDNLVMENTKKQISKYMSPVAFETNSELQQNQSTLTGKLKTEPNFLISKFENLLVELQPLKTKLNGTGEILLLDISKRVRNLLKLSYEDGDERVTHFNKEGGTFYKNLHSDFNIPNSTMLSVQDVKYLENILWHEIKIKEFLDEVKLIKEIQDIQNPDKTKERAYSHKEEYDIYKDLKQIFENASNLVFIVDSYVDETLYSLYLETIPSNVQVKILTKRPSPTFIEVGKKFAKKHLLEIVDSTSIHDRYIFVDEKCWTIGSSLKDAGKSKPTTLIQLGTARNTLYEMHQKFFDDAVHLL